MAIQKVSILFYTQDHMICKQLSRWEGVVLGIKTGSTASVAFPLQDMKNFVIQCVQFI